MNTSELRIRAAQAGSAADDAAAIARVHVASWRQAYRDLMPADFLAKLSTDARQRQWLRAIQNGSPTVLMAEVGNTLSGFIAFDRCRDSDAKPDHFEIWALYVDAAYWSQGVGKSLWLTALDQMRDRGASQVSLWVLGANNQAIRFYQAAGFSAEEFSAKSIEQDGVPLSEIRYVRTLGGS